MALKFIHKGRGGGNGGATEDVIVRTKGKKQYSITFNEDSLRSIDPGCKVPVSLMVAATDNRIYFVPSNKKSEVAFSVLSNKDGSRPYIKISKNIIDICKFEGVYNFHFDDKECAYYIDRKFLLR